MTEDLDSQKEYHPGKLTKIDPDKNDLTFDQLEAVVNLEEKRTNMIKIN